MGKERYEQIEDDGFLMAAREQLARCDWQHPRSRRMLLAIESEIVRKLDLDGDKEIVDALQGESDANFADAVRLRKAVEALLDKAPACRRDGRAALDATRHLEESREDRRGAYMAERIAMLLADFGVPSAEVPGVLRDLADQLHIRHDAQRSP